VLNYDEMKKIILPKSLELGLLGIEYCIQLAKSTHNKHKNRHSFHHFFILFYLTNQY
jgi:hypothetical protein